MIRSALRRQNNAHRPDHDHPRSDTMATRMLAAGIPVSVVMKFSGHEKYETFMKYVKKDLRMIQNAADAMNTLLRQNQIESSRANLALVTNVERSTSGLSEIEIDIEQ